jgi:hypothetical protein
MHAGGAEHVPLSQKGADPGHFTPQPPQLSGSL